MSLRCQGIALVTNVVSGLNLSKLYDDETMATNFG